MDGDAEPDASLPAEDCDDGTDNDGDALIDCADLDCSSFAGCCGTGGEEDTFTFSGSTSDSWLVQGNPDVEGGNVQFTATIGDPDTVTSADCYPLAQGAEFRPVFEFAESDPTCAPGPAPGPCEQYAAFYVSSVGTRSGGRIRSEFSMTIYQSGLVEFRLGGVLLDEELNLGAVGQDGEPFTMVLTFTPTTDAEGTKRMSVSARLSDGMGATIDLGAQLYDEDLTLGCSSENSGGEGVPGLLFGVEGTGTAVEVSTALRAKVFECTNPSIFRRDLNERPLAASGAGGAAVYSTGWSADDEGGMAWPELVRREVGGTSWQVLGSRTDQQPFFEPMIPNFRWDIASASNNDFRSEWDRNSDAEYFANASQPTAVELSEDLFVAARIDGLLRFGPDSTPWVPDDAPWMPMDGTCDEVSHPALALQPGGADPVPQFVMFYVCRLGTVTTIRWRRHKVSTTGMVENDTEVLNLNAFGEAASAQVKDLAVLIDPRGAADDVLVRLWVVGENPLLGDSLLLATGQYKLAEGPDASLSLFPYAGNPVGTANTLLEHGPGETATLEGVAVERESDASTRLRFLVSRRLELAGGAGRRWDFVPLTQAWGEL